MTAYAGIGSRRVPSNISADMGWEGYNLATLGFVLRSGGANGADTAFEVGCDTGRGKKEIYLPWKGFNGNRSHRYNIQERAYVIAEEVYPFGWNRQHEEVKNFMARNTMQILGETLDDPVAFVLCWTPDGCERIEKRKSRTGGTGQAIALASSLDVPVINMFNKDWKIRLETLLENL